MTNSDKFLNSFSKENVFSIKTLSNGNTTKISLLESGDLHEEIKKLEANNAFPYQHEVKDYFSFKQLPATTIRKYPFLKVLRIGKGKFLELPRLPHPALSAFGVLLLGIFLFLQNGIFFQADITVTNKVSPVDFDGAVYPFAKIPNWYVTGGKNSRLYSEYKDSELVDAPKYDINIMQKDDWEKSIVNTKITYPVVYMGKYTFDHKEGEGSHLAVDIKLPEGTPVFSISSGIVVKSQDLTSGFGRHIVVRHDKVPNYGTIYSSYSHLSERIVNVGDVVSKGQEIGKVGDTGNSTTPHIHFQIDLASAPFHPYWPFTTAEAKAAKVNFFEAINIGLGKEKGESQTIHPFEFINANIEGSRLASSNPQNKKVSSPAKTKEVISQTPIPSKKEISEKLLGYSVLAAPSKVLSGDTAYVTIYAKNQNGKWCASCNGSGILSYYEGKQEKTIPFTFKNGISEQKFTISSVGTTTFTVSGNAGEASAKITVLEKPKTIETPVSKIISKKIESLGSANVFKDISSSHPNAKAIAFLKKEGVTKGYGDGTFKPNRNVNRSETLKMMFEAFNIGSNRNVGNPFEDVSSHDWFSKYVLSAYDLDLIQGYSDGTFRPEKTVTRAEFFKILAKIKHVSNLTIPEKNPFSDVEAKTWIAPYAQWAKDNQLLDFGIEFSPNQSMKRSEMAEALYRVLN